MNNKAFSGLLFIAVVASLLVINYNIIVHLKDKLSVSTLIYLSVCLACSSFFVPATLIHIVKKGNDEKREPGGDVS